MPRYPGDRRAAATSNLARGHGSAKAPNPSGLPRFPPPRYLIDTDPHHRRPKRTMPCPPPLIPTGTYHRAGTPPFRPTQHARHPARRIGSASSSAHTRRAGHAQLARPRPARQDRPAHPTISTIDPAQPAPHPGHTPGTPPSGRQACPTSPGAHGASWHSTNQPSCWHCTSSDYPTSPARTSPAPPSPHHWQIDPRRPARPTRWATDTPHSPGRTQPAGTARPTRRSSPSAPPPRHPTPGCPGTPGDVPPGPALPHPARSALHGTRPAHPSYAHCTRQDYSTHPTPAAHRSASPFHQPDHVGPHIVILPGPPRTDPSLSTGPPDSTRHSMARPPLPALPRLTARPTTRLGRPSSRLHTIPPPRPVRAPRARPASDPDTADHATQLATHLPGLARHLAHTPGTTAPELTTAPDELDTLSSPGLTRPARTSRPTRRSPPSIPPSRHPNPDTPHGRSRQACPTSPGAHGASRRSTSQPSCLHWTHQDYSARPARTSPGLLPPA